jgi:hypothetical protein
LAQCLRYLLLYYPRKRLPVIHDRGAQYNGAPVEAVVREAGGRLMVKPLPAYSPEVNRPARM